uniref:Uncharacterized protein n=1 Tax=Tetranychus urticae TaxID=32264 RepID=T1KHJ7_TETUR
MADAPGPSRPRLTHAQKANARKRARLARILDRPSNDPNKRAVFQKKAEKLQRRVSKCKELIEGLRQKLEAAESEEEKRRVEDQINFHTSRQEDLERKVDIFLNPPNSNMGTQTDN